MVQGQVFLKGGVGGGVALVFEEQLFFSATIIL